MNFFPENFSNEFNNFLLILNNLFPNDEILLNVKNENLELRIQKIQNLINSLSSTTNFNNLCKSKIKLFSHKETNTQTISESIFGKKLSLKKIFNNQSDDIKLKLWSNLQKLILYLLEEEQKKNPSNKLKERISKLYECTMQKNIKMDETKNSIKKLQLHRKPLF
jgi:hypothetical protein